MKHRNIQALIYWNYLKSSLIPIFVIEVTLLLLYFGINIYISDKNKATLLNEATKNIEEIASREVTSINQQLMGVSDLALIMRRDHEAFFADPNACYLQNGKPEFNVHENGAFYKSKDNGGGSLYFANTTKISEKERHKALCSEILDPLLVSIVNTSSIITQAYLNTWDDMNRLYPYMPDAPAQYGAAIHMEDYNFYYEADSAHNPERKPVWTGVYLDPAGQGWMVSLIIPVYRGNFLEGVSGLDVTINEFVLNVLNLQFPWDAGTFMVDTSGTILAMQSSVGQIFKLKELGDHTYTDSVKETIEKPKEFNLLNSSDETISAQFAPLLASKERIAAIKIGGVNYLVSQEVVKETGWRMMTLIEESKVFAPITQLEELSNKAGFLAIAAMCAFYGLFFMFLLVKSKKLTNLIATPIIKLSNLTKDLGKHHQSEPINLSGIDEVDTLTKNFHSMIATLNQNFQEMELREKALQDKTREMELVITGAQIGTWMWDVQTGAIAINDKWANMLGYEKSEMTLHVSTWRELLHPEDIERVESTLADHLSGKTEVYVADQRLRHKSGHWIWVRDVGQIFERDATDAPLLVRGIHLEITELKEALQEIGEARKESDEIIANFLDSLLVVNRDLLITRINKEACSMLGYTQTELLGQPVSHIFQEDNNTLDQYFNFPWHEVTENQNELRNIELTFISANGKEHPVLINLARLTNDEQITIGVIAGAKDISALKEVMLETQSQKDFIENILNNAPGGVLVIGADNTLVRNNHTYDHYLAEWSEQYEVEPGSLHENLLALLGQALPHSPDGEIKLNLSASSHDLIIEYHASSRGDDPSIAAQVVFLKDATSRYQAEANRKLHSTVLEQTSDAVFVTDTHAVIRFANHAALSISGYREDEILGQKMSIFKSGLNEVSFYQHMWQTLINGKIWQNPLTNKKKDGSLFETVTTISAVRNQSGETTHYVSLWRDVSHERTLQHQLLQAQKMEAVGQLAAGVAHEINTPIQYIQNNVSFFQDSFNDLSPLLNDLQQLLQRPDKLTDSKWFSQLKTHGAGCDLEYIQDEIPKSIRESLDGINQVANIVSAMKEFSHPGGITLVPADLNKLIENTAIVTRNEWKYVSTLETDLQPDLPLMTCDPGAWSQILLNLIVNSAQAISTKENPSRIMGMIKIATRLNDEKVEFTITDTGGGISQENLVHIFEPFFTTKDVGKGTGQGLAIVYDLVVNKHKGTIDCTSDPGQGTTFTIKVPLKGTNA